MPCFHHWDSIKHFRVGCFASLKNCSKSVHEESLTQSAFVVETCAINCKLTKGGLLLRYWSNDTPLLGLYVLSPGRQPFTSASSMSVTTSLPPNRQRSKIAFRTSACHGNWTGVRNYVVEAYCYILKIQMTWRLTSNVLNSRTFNQNRLFWPCYNLALTVPFHKMLEDIHLSCCYILQRMKQWNYITPLTEWICNWTTQLKWCNAIWCNISED